MKRAIKFMFLFYFLSFVSIAQKQNNHWFFGDGCGLDFSNNQPVFEDYSPLDTKEGSSSISDANGNLLFYTDGVNVYNKYHILMPNGTGLDGDNDASQSALIVQAPGAPNLYYIITSSYELKYSVVDLTLMNGLGNVTKKNQYLLTNNCEMSAAVKHANGRDFWILTVKNKSKEFHAFLLTPNGFKKSVQSNLSFTLQQYQGNYLRVSPNGKKLVFDTRAQGVNLEIGGMSYFPDVFIYKFDNCSGKISDELKLSSSNSESDSYFIGGLAFSPNSKVLYATINLEHSDNTADQYMAQWDVSTHSQTIVQTSYVKLVPAHNKGSRFGQIQLGPNGKLYAVHQSASHLSTVHNPNALNVNCDLKTADIYLNGKTSILGLPNFPVYEASSDSLIVANLNCLKTASFFSLECVFPDGDITWDFGDVGSLNNSAVGQSVEHVYTTGGNYTVFAHYVFDGKSYSKKYSFTLKELPLVSLGNDTSICSGDTVEIGDPNLFVSNYFWSPISGLLQPLSNVSQLVIETEELIQQEYVLTVEDLSGCVNRDSINVTINPIPKDFLPSEAYLCPGDTISISSSIDGISYNWFPTNGISAANQKQINVFSLSSAQYLLDIVDLNGCRGEDSILINLSGKVPVDAGGPFKICLNDSVVIGGNPTAPVNSTVSWSNSSNSNLSNLYNPSVVALKSGSYYLLVSNDTCSGRDTADLIVYQLPAVTPLKDSAVCKGEDIVLRGVGASKYEWFHNTISLSQEDTVIITVESFKEVVLRIIDSNQCSALDTVSLFVKSLPVLQLSSDTGLCIGDSIQLFAESIDSIRWVNYNVEMDTILVSPKITTTYFATAYAINSCSFEDSVLVEVWDLPNISSTSDTVICKGQKTKLWASGGLSYTWTSSGNIKNSNSVRPTIQFQNAEIIQLKVVDSNACKDSFEFTVNVNALPISGFNKDSLAVCEGVLFSFEDASTQNTSSEWLVNGVSLGGESKQQDLFPFNSSNTLQLITSNNDICYDTLSYLVNLETMDLVVTSSVSNVLTPNNDGSNDCFEIIIDGAFENCSRLTIFNRWGLKVYEGNPYKACWDGSMLNGQIADKGTYFYILEIGSLTKNGFLQLIKE